LDNRKSSEFQDIYDLDLWLGIIKYIFKFLISTCDCKEEGIMQKLGNIYV